ncbi:MAG: hypothetical protein ACRD0Q_05915, partial [Acidimicrobiales bacterium]
MVGRLVATLFVAGVALGACGSEDGDSAPGGARGAYSAQADPICAEISAAVGQLGDDAVKDRDAVQAGVDKLNALSLPGEDIEKAEVFLRRLDNVALALEDVNQSRIQNDTPRAERALTTAREQAEQSAEAASSYGMVECGEPI